MQHVFFLHLFFTQYSASEQSYSETLLMGVAGLLSFYCCLVFSFMATAQFLLSISCWWALGDFQFITITHNAALDILCSHVSCRGVHNNGGNFWAIHAHSIVLNIVKLLPEVICVRLHSYKQKIHVPVVQHIQ